MRRLVVMLALVACSPGAVVASPSPPATERPTPTPTATPSPSPTPTPASTPTPEARASEAIHYVAIGASDTVGVGSADPATGSWPARIAALLPAGSTYVNLGVSGSLTVQALAQQLPGALRERPTLATIWLAVNDLNAGITAEDHGAALGAIIDGLVEGTDARVFVGNIPDLRAVPAYADADPEVLGALVVAYNAGILSVAAKHPGRVVLVDLFRGSADLTDEITVAGDGFHPSDAGYVLIAGRFAEAIREAGIPLSSDAP